MRVKVYEDYTGYNGSNDTNELLLAQYDSTDGEECDCIGGIGEESSDHTMQIHVYNNTASLLFSITNNDDILLSVQNWSYSGENTIGLQTDIDCTLEFYVNRNSLLGIQAKSVLKIDFDLQGISPSDTVLTVDDPDYIEGDYTLHDLLKEYFINDSMANSLTQSVIVTIHDAEAMTSRRRRLVEDNDVAITVLIFTDSAVDARTAKSDLAESADPTWNEQIEGIINGSTGSAPNTENIEYTLLTPDQAGSLEALEEGVDTEHVQWVIMGAIFGGATCCIFIAVIIIGYLLCEDTDKSQDKMEYMKPETTHDRISSFSVVNHYNLKNTSDDNDGFHNFGSNGEPKFSSDVDLQSYTNTARSNTTSGSGGYNGYNHGITTGAYNKYSNGARSSFMTTGPPGSGMNVAALMMNVSQKVLVEGKDSDSESESDESVEQGPGMADEDIAPSEFSARTTLIDKSSGADGRSIDEYLNAMIAKVTRDDRSVTLIEHNEIKLKKMIGSGNYGEVYSGTYDGNRVAIKTFPELEIKPTTPSLPILQESQGGGPSRSLKSLMSPSKSSGGYSTVNTVEDNEDDSIHSQSQSSKPSKSELFASEFEKKQYALKQEIYSEVVVACSLPPHPNLVEILGLTRDPLKIVMQFYDGGSVQNFVYRQLRRIKYDKKPIELSSIMILLQQMAEGICCLHTQGVVHRDIAARNVLLGQIGPDGQIRETTKVVISDFGMTRHLDSQHSKGGNRGVTKQRVGPIRWMAPESIRERKYSQKSDVYMFGITMWEVLYGKAPYSEEQFQTGTLAALAQRVVSNDERPVIDEKGNVDWILGGGNKKEVIGKMTELMKQCWRKEPKKRPRMMKVLGKLNQIYDSMNGIPPRV